MSKRLLPNIICTHSNLNRIIETADGERVCRCGVVLEERITERVTPSSSLSLPSSPSSQNKVSLYHQVEVGGAPQDMKVINKKIHIYTSGSSEFSNICSKLFMSEFIQGRAWHIYRMLRTHTNFTRAKCAIFSVYVACREGGQPINEAQIQDATQSILGVKNTPNALAVISEMHETALNLGINSNEGHSPGYYLNLEILKKAKYFAKNPQMYELFKKRTSDNFGRLSGNPQNRASRAVKISLGGMGLIT